VNTYSNADVMKYQRMVNMFINKMVKKNWNESQTPLSKNEEIILGNTGISIEDIRQDMYAEVLEALNKYNPDYRTAEGKSVLPSTFVYRHLFNRLGQKLKSMTKQRAGYGMWQLNLDEFMHERDEE
jgi:hypothetical protein